MLDVAARPAAGSAHHRAHGREGLRALRGEPRAGDARTAHPRLPRHRLVHREEQPRLGAIRPDARRDARELRLRPPLAPAEHLPARAAQGGGAAPRRAGLRARAQAQRILRRRPERRRHHRARRPLQHGIARAGAARPRRCLRQCARADLLPQPRLSADPRGGEGLLPRQEACADRRGRLARVRRAGDQHRAAPRRHPDAHPRQGRAAQGRRVHRRSDGARARELHS